MKHEKNGKKKKKKKKRSEITCITITGKKEGGLVLHGSLPLLLVIQLLHFFLSSLLLLLLHFIIFQIHPSSTFALHTMKKMNNILCNESNDLFFILFFFFSRISIGGPRVNHAPHACARHILTVQTPAKKYIHIPPHCAKLLSTFI